MVMPVICAKPAPAGLCRDVADAAMAAMAQADAAGAVYELGGPRVWTFRELLAYILEETGRHRMMMNVPMGWRGCRRGCWNWCRQAAAATVADAVAR